MVIFGEHRSNADRGTKNAAMQIGVPLVIFGPSNADRTKNAAMQIGVPKRNNGALYTERGTQPCAPSGTLPSAPRRPTSACLGFRVWGLGLLSAPRRLTSARFCVCYFCFSQGHVPSLSARLVRPR